jgi:hypothetical protein
MRTPTEIDDALAWHRRAMLDISHGLMPEVNPSPECGWFKTRLVRGGPWVAAKIWLEAETDAKTGELMGPEEMRCEVNGGYKDAGEWWDRLAGHPISEKDYQYLVDLRNYAVNHAPGEPLANPRRPVDWLKTDLPIFNRRTS